MKQKAIGDKTQAQWAQSDAKKATNTKSKSGGYTGAKFISPTLTAEHTAAIKAWAYDEVSAFQDLDRITEEYKVTLKFDTYSNATACWIAPLDPDHEDAGYILAGRGSTPLKALKQALWIWRVLGQGQTWKQFDKARVLEIDD